LSDTGSRAMSFPKVQARHLAEPDASPHQVTLS
jgi:hypothetical protein